MPPDLPSRGVPAAGDWITSHGQRFRQTGHGRFEFLSRSRPGHRYTIDIAQPPFCDCWPATRTTTNMNPCVHLQVLGLYLKKLRSQTEP